MPDLNWLRSSTSSLKLLDICFDNLSDNHIPAIGLQEVFRPASLSLTASDVTSENVPSSSNSTLEKELLLYQPVFLKQLAPFKLYTYRKLLKYKKNKFLQDLDDDVSEEIRSFLWSQTFKVQLQKLVSGFAEALREKVSSKHEEPDDKLRFQLFGLYFGIRVEAEGKC